MSYKVFLVEDEIVTREGIRDNVDWKAVGFEFCGEAQDGEMALQLIEKTQPDVMITDIKMPFMDGLQLCKIVKAQMPWIKIVVLSGHDEFEFAQEAVKLGVTEYLLKPISAAEIQAVLQNIAVVLDQEREARANLKELQNQVRDVLTLKQDRLLLDLVVGGISSSEAIEQYGRIGLNMLAKHYLVLLIKMDFPQDCDHVTPERQRRLQEIVSDLIDMHEGAFCTQKSMEELLFIMMGDDPEQLAQDGRFLVELIMADIEKEIGCQTSMGIGNIQDRLTNIHLSFIDALANLNKGNGSNLPRLNYRSDELVVISKLDRNAIERFLKTSLMEEFEAFYEEELRQLSEFAVHSTLVKHYLFVDIILTAAQFVGDLGGQAAEVIPVMNDVEDFLADLRTLEQIKQALNTLFTRVLAYRNEQASHEKAELIYRAKAFIDAHFSNPDLLLEDVAASANLSPSHFSLVFSRETGESFKSYLTRIRIEHAKELLRSTDLKCFEIAYQCGYSDPHYFSYAFKKHTGQPPRQFRQLVGV